MQNKLVLIAVAYCWAFLANANTANQEDIQAWLNKMAAASHMQTLLVRLFTGKITILQ